MRDMVRKGGSVHLTVVSTPPSRLHCCRREMQVREEEVKRAVEGGVRGVHSKRSESDDGH